MTTRINAGFDVLAITDRLTRTEMGAAPAELHVLSYLACIISLYDGKDPEHWSYGFTATPSGAPYAVMLDYECSRLRAAGFMVDRQEVVVLSDRGFREVRELRSFRSLSARERYLEVACAAATLLPLPSVADALSFEPQLQRALKAPSARELFKPVGCLLLREHFRALSEAIRNRSPNSSDLLVPTTVWLRYLSAAGRVSELQGEH